MTTLKTFLAATLFLLTAPLKLTGQTFQETVSWMHNASQYNYTADLKDGETDSTEVPMDNTCSKFVIVQKHGGK